MTETFRVLVVEDDPGKRYSIARSLRAQNFEVWEAETGGEGLALAVDQPDLIILDLKLPDMSGFEVARRLKSNPRTASILLLELTARYAAPSDRVRGLDEGADGYLIHPVDGTELVATVRSLLRLRRAERQRAELTAELEAGQHRYRTVTETATVGLMQIDVRGTCTFMNRAAEVITGRSFAELEGALLHGVLHPQHGQPSAAGAVCATGSLALDGVPLREVRDAIQCKDGNWIPVRLSASPIVIADECVGAVIELKDDSALVRAERARDLFLGALGHDLRAPLQTVALVTSLLETNPALGPKEHELLGRLTASTQRMQRLIDQMLVFAQSLVAGIPLERRPTDLAELCAQVVRDATLTARGRTLEITGARALHGEWDPDRLLQVVDNLVQNAIRHGQDPIQVRVDEQDESALLSVHNSGTPIPASALSTLFDPFQRAGDRSARGSGLGLYIVKSIVSAHGGHVSVESNAETGTTFCVRLPKRAPS
jgi:PAS domain S-box-containing protein